MSGTCQRLCIDDMCRGNPGNTLCGGCYCPVCHDPTYEEGECDDCRPSDDSNCDEDYGEAP